MTGFTSIVSIPTVVVASGVDLLVVSGAPVVLYVFAYFPLQKRAFFTYFPKTYVNIFNF